jgi:aminoglycoside phosphotransferase (APT) family kinase protein
MSVLDQASEVRSGEELDVAIIDGYMKQHITGLQGEPVITQFPGGASTLTYQISYGDQAYILRRPPFGKIAKGAHDMLREAKIMKALKPVYPYVPDIFAICEDDSVLGCNFYVMQKLTGVIPRQNMPKELQLEEAATRGMCLSVIDKVIELHQVNVKGTDLEKLGKGPGYVERQIMGWSDRYIKSMTDDATDFAKVMDWLKSNMPEDVAQVLIHNDFRLDNVVLNAEDTSEVIGVLDWEMATIGDPLMDLGNTLAYWIEADDDSQFQMMRRQPTHLKGMLTRQQVIDYYLEKTGYQVDSFVYYEVYGLFRLAVIMQQIYYRFFHGQTKDKRFASFVGASKYLESRCLKLIDSQ